ncbi:hypothetical protein CPC16_001519, partial [Podila verticillata]
LAHLIGILHAHTTARSATRTTIAAATRTTTRTISFTEPQKEHLRPLLRTLT